jgi:predicted NBD/HSP70 family sugar kinase
VLSDAEVADGTFRGAGLALGAHLGSPGLRFFDSSIDGRLAFGPGAGLVAGVSVGTESLRAALVDANGWVRATHDAEPMGGQLSAPRDVARGRIRAAVAALLAVAATRPGLLVDGALPLLGAAVAWPAPVSRAKRPVGHALAHSSWSRGEPLDWLVGLALGIKALTCFALNDTHAAAIGYAHRVTHAPDYRSWQHPQLTVVLRLAGGVGGAVIVIEPSEDARRADRSQGTRRRAGFEDTVLLAGLDNYAGEIGHVPVDPRLVVDLNR